MSTATVPRSLETMAPNARVWVYKSAIPFTSEQRKMIVDRGRDFTTSWAAHGAALDACVEVLQDHFVVIAVDEQQAMASGCSIDKSVHFVQALERALGMQLTDRMVVLYEKDGAIRTCRVPEVEGLLKSGELDARTTVFNDMVGNCGDLKARFRIPLGASWMSRFL
ncbi:MAG: hypothetical protein ABI599_16015 [Flavobacteriales bacterium]